MLSTTPISFRIDRLGVLHNRLTVELDILMLQSGSHIYILLDRREGLGRLSDTPNAGFENTLCYHGGWRGA